ncbi:hypothetical protein BZG36_02276 [Bifiguratus adelaidae]|uniref:CUE domain-containing protein n=1 Tax=Bifiguratus adelaidae TaxID=1938954 RepID=A0A261XY61_9FUNG|nr:hypothetical protein BZG36_02276 [Bifiguratus adelaidae]
MIPYIAIDAIRQHGIGEEDYLLLIRYWTNALSEATGALSTTLSQLDQGISPLDFVIQVLRQRTSIRAAAQNRTLSDAISSLLYQISLVLTSAYSQLENLTSSDTVQLVQPSTLLDLCGLFGRSPENGLAEMINSAIEYSPKTLFQFGASVDGMTTICQGIIDIVSKTNDHRDQETGITILNDLFCTMEAFACHASQCTAILRNKQRFLETAIAVYQSVLLPLEDQPQWAACRLALHQTRSAVILLFDTMIFSEFLQPMGFSRDVDGTLLLPTPGAHALDGHDINTLVDDLNDFITQLIEISLLPSDNITQECPFITALEEKCGIIGKLVTLRETLFHADEPRLNFLIISLEQFQKPNTGKMALSRSASKEIPASQGQDGFADTDAFDLASKISQVHDLFSDLGDGFIEACLKHYHGDAEAVIMSLLENTLPPELAKMDRSTPRPISPERQLQGKLAPLKERRNVFDNDEFDVFAGKKLSQEQAYQGKKSRGTADSMLRENQSFITEQKANILERVYNMYEDEYDDTYDDINTASGPIDITMVDEIDQDRPLKPTVERKTDASVEHEASLIQAYTGNAKIFERSSAARKSQERIALRKQTGMSDEQLEGWAIMLDRNPRKDRILDKYQHTQLLEMGKQKEMDEESRALQSESSKRGQKVRPPRSPEQQRSYNDRNKARVANHNRKKGHDKKMQKGFVPT